MQTTHVKNTQAKGIDWTLRQPKDIPRALQPAELRTASPVSGWGTAVPKSCRRSVHASLNGKEHLQTTWQNLDSQVYLDIVPGPASSRIYTFCRTHCTIMLPRLGSIGSLIIDPVPLVTIRRISVMR